MVNVSSFMFVLRFSIFGVISVRGARGVCMIKGSLWGSDEFEFGCGWGCGGKDFAPGPAALAIVW